MAKFVGPCNLFSLTLLVVAALFLAPSLGYAQVELPVSTPSPSLTPAAPAVSPAPAATTGELTASHLLRTVQAYLQTQKTWYAEVTVTSTLALSGMERSNVSRSRIWMRRPHHVVWTNQGDSGSSAMALDGNECILYLPSLMRYTATPYTGTADDHLLAMSSLLGPLASQLLAAEATSSSLEQLLAGPADLLGMERFYNMSCYKLRLPTPNGEVALWVAAGAHPLPVRMITTQALPPAAGTSGDSPSGSEVTIDFRWKLNVQLPDSTFKLNLPETAQRVDVLGGPNNTASTFKPGKGKKKPTSKSAKKKEPEDKGLAALGLAWEPPPVVGVGPGSGGSVPSLSDGLSGTGSVPRPAPQSTSVGTTQEFGASTPTAGTNSGATQNFAPPKVGQLSEPRQVQISNPAPDVVLPLMDGGKVRLSSLRGKKAVVLDFWATWCGPCRQAMPTVADAARAWKGRGVDFYAVNMAEAPDEVRSFSKQQGLSIPVAMDQDGSLAAAFGVSGIPHLVVIGRDGGIRGVHTGADSNLRQTLDRDLQSAL